MRQRIPFTTKDIRPVGFDMLANIIDRAPRISELWYELVEHGTTSRTHIECWWAAFGAKLPFAPCCL
jgi:hypothetical protein